MTRMRLLKLHDLGYEAFSHPQYSPEFLLNDYLFFRLQVTFFNSKNHPLHKEVENYFSFGDFIAYEHCYDIYYFL